MKKLLVILLLSLFPFLVNGCILTPVVLVTTSPVGMAGIAVSAVIIREPLMNHLAAEAEADLVTYKASYTTEAN